MNDDYPPPPFVTMDDAIRILLRCTGDNPDREGLAETPKRVADAYREWFSGYGQDPKSILKTFKDGSQGYDEMVVLRDTPFFSTCEHHMVAFFGTATIAYIPNGKIVGLSKLSRLLECFSRRLQTQERITTQVADALAQCLDPIGVAVVLRARHLCMESRGIKQHGIVTVTSALRGALKDKPEARAEFFSIANGAP